jgi:hypothetical protein
MKCLTHLPGNGIFSNFICLPADHSGNFTENQTLQAGDEEAIVVRLPNGDDPTDRGIAAALGRLGSWWDHGSRTRPRGCGMKSRADCDCLCHSGGIVLHVVQCCDGIASPPICRPLNCEGCSTFLHHGLSSFNSRVETAGQVSEKGLRGRILRSRLV